MNIYNFYWSTSISKFIEITEIISNEEWATNAGDWVYIVNRFRSNVYK